MLAILTIGDELLLGEVVDGNAARIGAQLYRHGLKVQRRLTVGDVEADIVDAIGYLAAKSDAVVVTGGLGPTVDDITARAAARAAGTALVMNEEALAHVRRVAGKMGGTSHPRNDSQALIPHGAALIANPLGTACGFSLEHHGCTLFFLPGVPAEMARMLEETVLPALVRRREPGALTTRMLRLFGISEAEADARLSGMALPAGVSVAFGVEFPEIHLKLRGEGAEESRVEASLAEAAELVRRELGDFMLGEEQDTMDALVAAGLRRTGLTLSLAESCTGGMVAKRITDLPGSSAYFLEGAVTYTDAAKTRVLGVPALLLAEHGAVSSETALAMASGMRCSSGSDLSLAVTGIAGPGGGSAAKPVGTVYLALATPQGCNSKGYRFSGSRDEIRTITVWTALDWLRRYLAAL